MKTFKKTNWPLILLLLGLGLSIITGCRTAHGFGEDVERAGEGIQRGTE